MPGFLPGSRCRAVYLVLLEWSRAAELSADRASALVVGDPLVTCQMLMRIAGGALDGMSLDAFLAQAARYADEEDVLARWSRAWVEASHGHPFAVKRARELMSWVSDGSYDRSGPAISAPGPGAAGTPGARRGHTALPGALLEDPGGHCRRRRTLLCASSRTGSGPRAPRMAVRATRAGAGSGGERDERPGRALLSRPSRSGLRRYQQFDPSWGIFRLHRRRGRNASSY